MPRQPAACRTHLLFAWPYCFPPILGYLRVTVLVTILLTTAIRKPIHAPKISDQHNPWMSAVDEVMSAVVNNGISPWVALNGVSANSQQPANRMPLTIAPVMAL